MERAMALTSLTTIFSFVIVTGGVAVRPTQGRRLAEIDLVERCNRY
jgi:hypothetical protein